MSNPSEHFPALSVSPVRRLWRCSLGAAMALSLSIAFAVPPASLLRVESPGSYKIGQGLLAGSLIEVAVDESHRNDTWPEEWLILTVKDSSKRILGSRSFYSSYGKFRIDIIDLDGDHVPEFLFVVGNGRGTSTREEVLLVTHFIAGHFQQVASLPVSGFYGPGSEWRYSMAYREFKTGRSPELVLRLQVDPGSASGLIPRETLKVVRWGPNATGTQSPRAKGLTISNESRQAEGSK